MEAYESGTGQRMHVHSKEDCLEGYCVIHNPSDHHMQDWATNYRPDRGLMERICPHGVGHPDPDCISFQKKHYMGGRNPDAISTVHGCDGCCAPP